MSDEPLAVLVAKALGWTDVTWDRTGAWGRPPGSSIFGVQIPRYGIDAPDGWAATGPLLSERGFSLIQCPDTSWDCLTPGFVAGGMIEANAPSAPEAIARLVVKLHELGKLKA